MLFDQLFRLEIGNAHRDAQGFGFIAARDHTAIIIAEYYHGFMHQVGTEQSLTRAIKTITINDRDHISGRF